MKRIDISTLKPNFIGCWNLENKTLCDEIVTFFQSNKNLSKEGTTTLGKNIEAKKTTDKIRCLSVNVYSFHFILFFISYYINNMFYSFGFGFW